MGDLFSKEVLMFKKLPETIQNTVLDRIEKKTNHIVAIPIRIARWGVLGHVGLRGTMAFNAG